MTQSQPRPEDETTNRAAVLIAQALTELQQQSATSSDAFREELAAGRAALEAVVERLEAQLNEDKEERRFLAGQLSQLATSLDRLVDHLHVVADIVAGNGATETPPPAVEAAPLPEEPRFQPGGEGVSLVLSAVPGFQALMEIQKALTALDAVEGASVERFQEGDSRILVHLRAPLGAEAIAAALRESTSHNFLVEESQPELSRLRLRIVPAA